MDAVLGDRAIGDELLVNRRPIEVVTLDGLGAGVGLDAGKKKYDRLASALVRSMPNGVPSALISVVCISRCISFRPRQSMMILPDIAKVSRAGRPWKVSVRHR
ncbi:MAG: hypothetical protein ACRECE_01860 [Xanthobacteraceae bacterium]